MQVSISGKNEGKVDRLTSVLIYTHFCSSKPLNSYHLFVVSNSFLVGFKALPNSPKHITTLIKPRTMMNVIANHMFNNNYSVHTLAIYDD